MNNPTCPVSGQVEKINVTQFKYKTGNDYHLKKVSWNLDRVKGLDSSIEIESLWIKRKKFLDEINIASPLMFHYQW